MVGAEEADDEGFSYEQEAIAFQRHARLRALEMAHERAPPDKALAEVIRDAQVLFDFVMIEHRATVGSKGRA